MLISVWRFFTPIASSSGFNRKEWLIDTGPSHLVRPKLQGFFRRLCNKAVSHLKEKGIRLVQYLDDILIIGESREQLTQYAFGPHFTWNTKPFSVTIWLTIMITQLNLVQMIGVLIWTTVSLQQQTMLVTFWFRLKVENDDVKLLMKEATFLDPHMKSLLPISWNVNNKQ